MKARISILLIAAMLLAALAGCGGDGGSGASSPAAEAGGAAGGGDGKYGGTLRIITANDINGLGFPPSQGSYEMLYSQPAIESLGRYNADGEIEPWLAKGFEVDHDALTVTIPLNEGIQFHDGTPFNAEAVIANFEMYNEAGVTDLAVVERFEAVDEYTVVAHLSSWKKTIVEALGFTAGRMISPTFVEENGTDGAIIRPVGTGPYIMDVWVRNASISYSRNDNYWIEGMPYLDGIEFIIMSDQTTAASAFKNGEAELIFMPSYQQAQELENAGFEKEGGDISLGAGVYGLIYASANEDDPVSNLLVRQAISHALDRELLVEVTTLGYGIPTDQWAQPGSASYNDEVAGYDYDPDKARALLAEAGYPDGCTITIHYQSGNENYVVPVMAMLAEVGISVEQDIVDSTVFGQYVRRGTGNTWTSTLTWNSKISPDDWYRTIASDGLMYSEPILHNEEMEAYLPAIEAATSTEEYDAAVLALQKLMIDEYCLMTPTTVTNTYWFTSGGVADSGINTTHSSIWTPERAYLN